MGKSYIVDIEGWFLFFGLLMVLLFVLGMAVQREDQEYKAKLPKTPTSDVGKQKKDTTEEDYIWFQIPTFAY